MSTSASSRPNPMSRYSSPTSALNSTAFSSPLLNRPTTSPQPSSALGKRYSARYPSNILAMLSAAAACPVSASPSTKLAPSRPWAQHQRHDGHGRYGTTPSSPHRLTFLPPALLDRPSGAEASPELTPGDSGSASVVLLLVRAPDHRPHGELLTSRKVAPEIWTARAGAFRCALLASPAPSFLSSTRLVSDCPCLSAFFPVGK